MRLHHLVVDDILERPHIVREWAMTQTFQEETSPADGVVYRGIKYPIPDLFVMDLHTKLTFLLGYQTIPRIDFLRLSILGYDPPHRIHTDQIQAEFTAITYLNPPEQCVGGTGIYEHESGMASNPIDEQEHKKWLQDTNDFGKWRVVGGGDMKWNRALVMPSALFHASFPKEGFGVGLEDGRLVWVSFFNIMRN